MATTYGKSKSGYLTNSGNTSLSDLKSSGDSESAGTSKTYSDYESDLTNISGNQTSLWNMLTDSMDDADQSSKDMSSAIASIPSADSYRQNAKQSYGKLKNAAQSQANQSLASTASRLGGDTSSALYNLLASNIEGGAAAQAGSNYVDLLSSALDKATAAATSKASLVQNQAQIDSSNRQANQSYGLNLQNQALNTQAQGFSQYQTSLNNSYDNALKAAQTDAQELANDSSYYENLYADAYWTSRYNTNYFDDFGESVDSGDIGQSNSSVNSYLR